MTYNLYLESGGQAHVVTLAAKNDNCDKLVAPVLLTEHSEGCNILLLLPSLIHLVSSTGKRADKTVIAEVENTISSTSGKEQSAQLNDKNNLTLILKESEKPLTIREQESSNGFKLRKHDEFIEVLGPAWKDVPTDLNSTYNITIKYVSQEVEYSVQLQSRNFASDSLFDVVLDFGSDSSQMLVTRHKERPGISRLLPNVLNHFYNGKDPKLYDQYDEDSGLYKSIFFAGNMPLPSTKDELASFICAAPGDNDMVLQFATLKKSANKGQRQPNIKISYLADSEGTGKSAIFHRAIVMRFLREAIKEMGAPAEKPIGIIFTILIPNVMEQSEVSSLVKDISLMANDEHFLSNCGLNPKSAIKVRPCSESDASFQYWFNDKCKERKPGNYLIVDMGKGTTDLSIVSVKDHTHAISLYRSGFLGAGNAISYSIFESYMFRLYRRNWRKEISNLLINSSQETLYKLDETIEYIKRNGRRTSLYDDWAPSSSDYDEIIEQMKEKPDLLDNRSFIVATLAKILSKIIESIPKGIALETIIFSGRSFKYKPLRDMIKGVMDKKYCKNILFACEDEHNDDWAKRGALYGPLRNVNINNYSCMVGVPMVRNTKLETIDIDPEKLKKFLAPESQKNMEAVKAFFSEIKGKLYSASKEMSDQFNDFAGQNEKAVSKPRNEEFSTEPIMKQGYPIPTYGNNTHIYISGSHYSLRNPDARIDANGKYELYFDGEKFFLRSDEYHMELTVDEPIPNRSLLFESLFPFTALVNTEHLSVPQNDPIIAPIRKS